MADLTKDAEKNSMQVLLSTTGYVASLRIPIKYGYEMR